MDNKLLKCEICEKFFIKLTTHIPKHNITSAEYIEKFPDSPLHGYKHDVETLDKMRGPRECMRGKPKSPEHRANLSAGRKGRKFKPHKPETIEKMKQAWERRRADPEAYDEYVKLLSEKASTEEAKMAVRNRNAIRIKNNNGTNGKFSNTSIENKMKKFLSSKNISFEHQYTLTTRKGNFLFDFYLPSLDLLVEVDGEYWHAKKLETINRDRLKNRLAEELGFTVARITDQDWNPDIILSSKDVITEANEYIINNRLRNFDDTKTEEFDAGDC